MRYDDDEDKPAALQHSSGLNLAAKFNIQSREKAPPITRVQFQKASAAKFAAEAARRDEEGSHSRSSSSSDLGPSSDMIHSAHARRKNRAVETLKSGFHKGVVEKNAEEPRLETANDREVVIEHPRPGDRQFEKAPSHKYDEGSHKYDEGRHDESRCEKGRRDNGWRNDGRRDNRYGSQDGRGDRYERRDGGYRRDYDGRHHDRRAISPDRRPRYMSPRRPRRYDDRYRRDESPRRHRHDGPYYRDEERARIQRERLEQMRRDAELLQESKKKRVAAVKAAERAIETAEDRRRTRNEDVPQFITSTHRSYIENLSRR